MKIFLFLFLFVPILTYGQPSPVPLSDSSRSPVVTLDEVVVSVNKAEESRKDIAQQVQQISYKEISELPCMTTADLLEKTGTASVQKSQLGGGSPVLRGFEASRILLVVDGVRLNNLIYRAGHLQNVLTLDQQSLEKVEILYGPSSTIYGSDALGGVIHFYTKKPVLATDTGSALRLNAYARYGSASDEMTGHMDFNLASKKIASFTSFTLSQFGDLRGGESENPFYKTSYGERPYYAERINGIDSLIQNSDRFVQTQSSYNQFDLVQKLLFSGGSRTKHGLNFQLSGSTDIPRYDRLTDPAGSGLRYSEWYYGPQERMMVAYDLDRTSESSYFQDVHLGLNYQAVEESRHQRRFGRDALQHRIENIDAYGATLHAARTSGAHHLRTGVDLFYSTVVSTANEEDIVTGERTPLDTRYPDGDNSQFHGAAYFSHTWEFAGGWVLNDGLRAGYSTLHAGFADTTFFAFPFTEVDQENLVYSGSLGVVRNAGESLKLSLLLSSGFRLPNIDDLSKVFESAPGMLIVPNPELGPEKTLNLEAGVSAILWKSLRWENAVYVTEFYDAIVTAPFTYNGEDSVFYNGSVSGVYANQNHGKARIYGFSSSLVSQAIRHVQLALNMNFTRGRLTGDQDGPLDHIPPFQMRFLASWSSNHAGVDLSVLYNGWKKIEDYNLNGEDNAQYATPEGMPAWYTLNLLGRFSLNQNLTVYGGVENILDTQYRTFSSGINGSGRNLTLALRYKI